MRRALLVLSLLAVIYAPAALADGGPSPGVMTGWDGVSANGGAVRYVAIPTSNQTIVAAVQKNSGRILRYSQVDGQWGIPMVSFDGTTAGLTRDHRAFVLAQVPTSPFLRKHSTFLVVNTKRMTIRERDTLNGDFSFDALSPDGKTMYLIQHVDARDVTRYVVRAYDLEHSALEPGAIADKTQRGWVMAGQPMARATSTDGRWVYTLYARPAGYPFVHVLDAVNGVAHCVGIPWKGNQDGLWRMKLAAGSNGVTIVRRSGAAFATIDVKTFRFDRATPQKASFPWWIAVVVLAVATPGSLLGRSLRRRRSAATLA